MLHQTERHGEDVRTVFCRWNVVESNSFLLNFVSGTVVFDVDMFVPSLEVLKLGDNFRSRLGVREYTSVCLV
jgi:hypothetical protein